MVIPSGRVLRGGEGTEMDSFPMIEVTVDFFCLPIGDSRYLL